MPEKIQTAKAKTMRPSSAVAGMLRDLRALIAEARQVNSTLVVLHWRIGKRILQDILKEKRADYGEKIVSAEGSQLEREFGRGFGGKEPAADDPVRGGISRRANCRSTDTTIELDPLSQVDAHRRYPKRDFYAEMCRVERWSRDFTDKNDFVRRQYLHLIIYKSPFLWNIVSRDGQTGAYTFDIRAISRCLGNYNQSMSGLNEAKASYEIDLISLLFFLTLGNFAMSG